jgi:hypothetical protein
MLFGGWPIKMAAKNAAQGIDEFRTEAKWWGPFSPSLSLLLGTSPMAQANAARLKRA